MQHDRIRRAVERAGFVDGIRAVPAIVDISVVARAAAQDVVADATGQRVVAREASDDVMARRSAARKQRGAD
ncbi:hypothetical protein FQZ97_721290 [compost metagenome]